MVYQAVIAAGLAVFLLNLLLNLRLLKRPRADAVVGAPVPLVSVLIPARDEEVNIGRCLEGLVKQDYSNFEVVVLDDNSSDGTAGIVRRVADTDSRVSLIVGEPLPKGWAGKPFACHQLAKKARGSWLLFVDADTVHEPSMLRSVLALSLRLGPSLLSGFPRQLTASLPQKVAIPVIYFIVMGWMPLWWVHRSKKTLPSLAVGQFMLFPAEEYWRIGGHEAVKSQILDDIWMAVAVCRHGGKHVAVDLSRVVSCDMYRSVGAMWEGLVRSLYSIVAVSRLGLLALLGIGYFFFLLPFYSLWSVLVTPGASLDVRGLVFFQVAVILLMRGLVDNRFHEPLISGILHPFGFSFIYLAALYASALRIVGARVHWKRRVYSADSCAEAGAALVEKQDGTLPETPD